MAKLRIVHYLNQFFAGVGGEEEANTPPGIKDGPVGPAQALHNVLSNDDAGEIVATVYCGDNHITEHGEEALEQLLGLIGPLEPDVVVAGPSFGSGRYGLACGQVCAAVNEQLDIPVVSGMHKDSPGAQEYRTSVYIASTTETAIGMADAIATMARLTTKLGRGQELGPADEEGYVPTGRVKNEFSDRTIATRLVDMLLKKVKGEPFETEWPLPAMEKITPSPALADLSNAKIALVTEGGVVPKGNPDKIPGGWAEHWARYNISETERLDPENWQSVHGGFDTTDVNRDPDRVLPLDALRDLEKEKAVGKVHDYVYTTVGNLGYVSNMRKFGKEIAKELLEANVDGVILTGT